MRFLTLLLCACFASFILFFGQTMAQIVVPTKLNVELRDLTKEARTEIECLAQNIYFEAAQEPREGQIAVAQVTRNRMISGKYPTTYCGVVKQKADGVCQFSWFCQERAKAIISRKALTPDSNLLYNSIVDLSMNFYLNPEDYDDPSKGALFYHADYVKPTWSNMRRTAYIGRHIFYNRVKQRNV